jgi:hypothetical protein
MTDQPNQNRPPTTGAAAGGPKVTPAGAGKTASARPAAARTKPTASGAAAAKSPAGAKSPTANRSATAATGAASKTATIRFLSDWREEVTGDVRAGGRLRVEYAAERLPGGGTRTTAKTAQDVVAEVRFGPGGQHHTGRVTGGKFEVDVPADANEVMIWFYRTDGAATSWDSRFGENYRFSVSGAAGQARPRTTGKSSNRRPASAA